MNAISKHMPLSSEALAAALATGAIEFAPSFVALVDTDPGDAGGLRFSIGVTCDDWTRIPSRLIASLTPRDLVSCADHRHLLVEVQLLPGADPETRALLRIVGAMQSQLIRVAGSARDLVQPREADAGADGACRACLDACAGLPWQDYLSCTGNCIATVCRRPHDPRPLPPLK